MPSNYPNNFPSVVSGSNPPLLLIGAGMSFGSIPGPKVLAERLMSYFSKTPHLTPSKCPTCGNPESPNGCLYCLSENFLATLSATKSIDDQRYELAELIGLFSDDMWVGNVELPFNRNFGRHRAIARLATDGRIHCVISLNWDALLEKALEAIGMTSAQPQQDQPGEKTAYAVIVDDKEEHSPIQKQFLIYKPHGCVEKLRNNRSSSPIFKITHSDLEKLNNDAGNASNPNPDVTHQIYAQWKQKPMIICGWSASEEYLKTISKKVKENGKAPTSDCLSVIDCEWQHPSHSIIADSCGSDKDASFFPVTTLEKTDRLFLWVYTRFAVHELSNKAPPDTKLAMQNISNKIGNFDPQNNSVIEFCDNFIPSWTRLCCRLGLVDFYRDDGTKLDPSRIPLTPRDWHVPYKTHQNSSPDCRPDLQAATRLLIKLIDHSSIIWNLSAFPGALWHSEENTLLMPVPHFGETRTFDLSGMKPMIEEGRRYGMLASIKKIILLPLHASNPLTTEEGTIRNKQFSSALFRLFPSIGLISDDHGNQITLKAISINELNSVGAWP